MPELAEAPAADRMRQILAYTRNRSAIQAAARACGVQCALRAFSPPDLMELRAPLVLAFDADGKPEFEPDFLQYLRRTHPGGVRYSPAVVFCQTKEQQGEWLAAGAVPISERASAQDLIEAVKEAVLGSRKWVTSTTYVGPDRRLHKALLRLRKRRREDGAQIAAKKAANAAAIDDMRVSSPALMHRRLFLASQLLQGASIESRRAFRGMIDELEVSARAHGRSDILGLSRTLKTEADRLLKDGAADTQAVETAVSQLGAVLGR
jgi:hypothetical protein